MRLERLRYGLDMGWQERAIANSTAVERSKNRSVQRAKSMIDAARELMVAGNSQPTVQELVDKAGVSLQTFYRYFQSKDQLLLAVMETDLLDGMVRIRAAAAREPTNLGKLRCVLTQAIVDLIGLDPARAKRAAREHHDLVEVFPAEVEKIVGQYIGLLAEIINDAIMSGEIDKPDLDVDMIARNLGLLTMTRFHHAAHGAFAENPLEQVANDLCAIATKVLDSDTPV